MGLDQFWYRERYESQTFYQPEDVQSALTVDGKKIPIDNLGGMTHRTTSEVVGYLRKANAVHGWIVENLADGLDECQKIYLQPHHLQALISDIDHALGTGEGMDPAAGFFFGSLDKDDWWKQDLERARNIATWLLQDMEDDSQGATSWYYLASW